MINVRQQKRLDVHHLTYERFGKELLADLQILCRKCHDEVHAIKDQQKPKVKINKPSKRQKRIKKQKFKFNPNVRANRKLKKSKARKVPVGSTIVLKIRNPDPNSPHLLPARLRNKNTEPA